MSLNSKQQLWIEVCQARYPTISEAAALAMCPQAATEYYLGGDKTLVEMFEQYIMLKTLKGIN